MKKELMGVALAVAALVAGPALSAGLSKYKGWAESPEAYFLTKAERQSWSTVDSDEKAEAFIGSYRSVRGGGFAAAIKSRIEFADKAFGLGKKKGSETLRGKTLVIFGPPTKVDEAAAPAPKAKEDPTSGELGGGGGDRGSGSVGNSYSNAGGSGPDSMRGMKASVVVKKSTSRWSYDAKSVPAALKTPDLTLEFTVYPDEAREETPDPAKLQKMLEEVVEFWAPKK